VAQDNNLPDGVPSIGDYPRPSQVHSCCVAIDLGIVREMGPIIHWRSSKKAIQSDKVASLNRAVVAPQQTLKLQVPDM
jgi:hypothetical protein